MRKRQPSLKKNMIPPIVRGGRCSPVTGFHTCWCDASGGDQIGISDDTEEGDPLCVGCWNRDIEIDNELLTVVMRAIRQTTNEQHGEAAQPRRK